MPAMRFLTPAVAAAVLCAALPARAGGSDREGGDEPPSSDDGGTPPQPTSLGDDALFDDTKMLVLFGIVELGALAALETNLETVVRGHRRLEVGIAGVVMGAANIGIGLWLLGREETDPSGLPGDDDATWGGALTAIGAASIGAAGWNLFLTERPPSTWTLAPGGLRARW
jgi:hypothetical protein